MMEEKYSQNERIKKFALIVCGLTFVSVVLSLLTYWVYVQWNKVEPKKDCTTRDFQKCSILYGTISNGNEFNNCSWYENKETVWCQTIYSDNEKLTKYGYCQANCSSPVPGYDQLIVLQDGMISSCSHEHSIEVFIKTETRECQEICNKHDHCKYFYSNDSEYCIIYKSCHKSRIVTTLGNDPGRTYIKLTEDLT